MVNMAKERSYSWSCDWLCSIAVDNYYPYFTYEKTESQKQDVSKFIYLEYETELF